MGFCGYYIKTKKGRLVGGFIEKSAKEAKNSRMQGRVPFDFRLCFFPLKKKVMDHLVTKHP